jgi:Tol biopolymer transport system component
MKPRPDLVHTRSPQGIEVFQITNEPGVRSSNIYMEAQIFTPDSRRFVVHRSAHPHGSDQHDPEHRYLLCDMDNDGELSPLTSELGTTGPSISPDGKWFYYFVNETSLNAGRLLLKRCRLDGGERETVAARDTPFAETGSLPSAIYPLSTISSDGKRIAISGFLGDGVRGDIGGGLMVFDIDTGESRVILHGGDWINIHPQYSRSLDPQASHDLLVQHNHGAILTPDGTHIRGCDYQGIGGRGVDVHVIRDDGSNFRSGPFGRDMHEYCQGHQCWRGRSDAIIASCGMVDKKIDPAAGEDGPHEEVLREGWIVNDAGHEGRLASGAKASDLSRDVKKPRFFHFATDLDGKRFVTDANPQEGEQGGCDIFVADLGKPVDDPLLNMTFVLDTRSRWRDTGHVHPCLSPDGKVLLFNSNESGLTQAYMARGF